MNIREPILKHHEELTSYRREMHQNPGTAYEEKFISEFIAKKLTEWGVDFKSGIAETGIVATIEGKENTSGKSIGLRADMDALNILEDTNKQWMSLTPGKMHACGHDGHSTMLLGAAKYLKENPNFNGKVHLIFQPAEEGAGGANKMLAEGLFKHFPCNEIYAFHNWPWLPLGQIAMRPGAMMAGSSRFFLTVRGVGGHAAQPEKVIDPIVIASQIVTAVQTLVNQYTDPTHRAIISVTNFNAGTGAHNIIPEEADLVGSVRTFDAPMLKTVRNKLTRMASDIAGSLGAVIDLDFETICEPTINNLHTTAFCGEVAEKVVGGSNVDTDIMPFMISEDFGAMLIERPGTYLFLGQRMPDVQNHPSNYGLHTAQYDFNDGLIPIGVEYWAKLVEEAMPLS